MTDAMYRKMKRIAKPMVEREQDWQRILEDVKDELNLPANDENFEAIMSVIRDCEDEYAEAAWEAHCNPNWNE